MREGGVCRGRITYIGNGEEEPWDGETREIQLMRLVFVFVALWQRRLWLGCGGSGGERGRLRQRQRFLGQTRRAAGAGMQGYFVRGGRWRNSDLARVQTVVNSEFWDGRAGFIFCWFFVV